MLLKAVKMGRSSQGSGTFLKTLCVCLNEGAVRGERRYLDNPADKAAPVDITALSAGETSSSIRFSHLQ